MSKPSKELVAGCVVLLSVGILPAAGAADRGHPLASPSAEVFLFEGKPLSTWIAALKNKDPDVRLNAVLAFRRMRPAPKEAVGPLLAALKDEDHTVHFYALDALANIGRPAVPLLIAALKDHQIRPELVVILSKMGADADAAVPALVDLLREKPVTDKDEIAQLQALYVLGRMGKGAVGPLLRALKDKNPEVREKVATALGTIGREAEAAVASLLAALQDNNAEVRAAAASALGQIGKKPEAVIAPLVRALRDEDDHVRRAACFALVGIDRAGVPPVLAALKDPNPQVRAGAARALGHFGIEAKAIIKPLIAALGDDDLRVGREAALALSDVVAMRGGKPGPLAEAIPALIRALKDRDRCGDVAVVLADMGSKAVPSLIPVLKDEDADVRSHAILALRDMGPEARAAVPALIERLNDGNRDVRTYATMALGFIGPAAKSAVPALGRTVNDNAAGSEAVEALGRIGEASLPVLLEGWKTADAKQRALIASALAHMGPKAKVALPLLIEALADEHAPLCEAAAGAVGAMGPAARPAVPALILLLRRKEDSVRQAAVQALKRLGPEAEAAVPALVVALRDREFLVRHDAVAALGKIGPRAKDAVAPLIAVRRGAKAGLRKRAARALWKIDPCAARKAGIPRAPDDEPEDDE